MIAALIRKLLTELLRKTLAKLEEYTKNKVSANKKINYLFSIKPLNGVFYKLFFVVVAYSFFLLLFARRLSETISFNRFKSSR
jgi:hypothetical protein